METPSRYVFHERPAGEKVVFERQGHGLTAASATECDAAASYQTGGQDKTIVIARLTPRPPDEYTCHACVPLIGGAAFVRSETGWKIDSRAQIIGFGNGAEKNFSLAQIGPGRYGVLFRLADRFQNGQYSQCDTPQGFHR